MIARSTEELQRQIMDKMEQAMHTVEQKSIKRIDNSFLYFYSGGTPVQGGYQRTGHLMDTRETDPVTRGGLSVQFRAYLNESVGGYTTGKKPSMTAVLNLTNFGASAGLRPAVGRTGWWNKAESEIQADFDSTFARYFH